MEKDHTPETLLASLFNITTEDNDTREWKKEFSTKIKNELPKHLQETSLTLTSDQSTSYTYYSEFELPELNDDDRRLIFKVLFPSIHGEVDLAWRTLDPNTIVQRDFGKGGDSGRAGLNQRATDSPEVHQKNLSFLVLRL